MTFQADGDAPLYSSGWHALETDEVLARLATSRNGLSQDEAERRLRRTDPIVCGRRKRVARCGVC